MPLWCVFAKNLCEDRAHKELQEIRILEQLDKQINNDYLFL